MSDVAELMKRCQRGVGGRNALDEAHDIMAECYGTLGRLEAERDALRQQLAERDAEIERLRMQLAACGVVALANTPESACGARQMHPDYGSASCSDVADAVDREMTLRQQRDKLAGLLREVNSAYTTAIHWEDMRAAMAQIKTAMSEPTP